MAVLRSLKAIQTQSNVQFQTIGNDSSVQVFKDFMTFRFSSFFAVHGCRELTVGHAYEVTVQSLVSDDLQLEQTSSTDFKVKWLGAYRSQL